MTVSAWNTAIRFYSLYLHVQTAQSQQLLPQIFMFMNIQIAEETITVI